MIRGVIMDKNKMIELFFDGVLTLENTEDCEGFFSDLCTPKELQTRAQRFAVAKLLSEGKVYAEIVNATGASTATVSRVNRTMTEATKKALSKIE